MQDESAEFLPRWLLPPDVTACHALLAAKEARLVEQTNIIVDLQSAQEKPFLREGPSPRTARVGLRWRARIHGG
jgi:hypothetical protein